MSNNADTGDRGDPAELIRALAAIEQRLALMRIGLAGPLHLTANDTRVLTALMGAGGRAKIADLTALVGTRSGTMTTMLDRLAQSGLVVRTSNRADRRSVIVELTCRGEHTIGASRRHLAAGIVSAMTPEAVAQTTANLNGLADELDRSSDAYQAWTTGIRA